MQRVKDMMSALTQMLEADARGEHEQQDFDDFMAEYGDMFPDTPANLEELVDSLVRRMQAAQRLLDSRQRRPARGAGQADVPGDGGRRAGGRDGPAGRALRARRPGPGRRGLARAG